MARGKDKTPRQQRKQTESEKNEKKRQRQAAKRHAEEIERRKAMQARSAFFNPSKATASATSSNKSVLNNEAGNDKTGTECGNNRFHSFFLRCI